MNGPVSLVYAALISAALVGCVVQPAAIRSHDTQIPLYPQGAEETSPAFPGLLQNQDGARLISSLSRIRNVFPLPIECDACKLALSVVQGAAVVAEKDATDLAVWWCTKFKVQDADVCQGLADEFGPSVAQILRNSDWTSYTKQLACATVVDACPYPDAIESGMTFPPPPSVPHPPISNSSKPLTVVHISDWHYDPQYQAGTEALCTKPLCCRGFNASSPDKATLPAPSWGAYECDTPLKLGISMLQSVQPLIGSALDFAIFTGDVPPHNIWDSTPSSAVAAEQETFSVFHQYLNTTVYPAVGNHETSPTDLFQQDAIANPPDNQWLYDNLTENDWVGWLDNDVLTYARTHRGSYATSPVPGLKIISLNSNECYVQNYWLLIDTADVDPNGQLAWLSSELHKSEIAGEKVWIIGHVPPGVTDCVRSWSNLHYQIIQRYHKVIAGIFSGHTHWDEFQIYYSDDSRKTPQNAISVGWIGPSVTPFTQLNPGWREYRVDPVTFEILDSITYIANLSLTAEWDATGEEPIWFKEYSARDYLPTWPEDAPLNATFWALVVESFEADDALFQTYYHRRSKMGPNAAGGCNAACKSHLITNIKAGNSSGAVPTSIFKMQTDGQDNEAWSRNMCGVHSYH